EAGVSLNGSDGSPASKGSIPGTTSRASGTPPVTRTYSPERYSWCQYSLAQRWLYRWVTGCRHNHGVSSMNRAFMLSLLCCSLSACGLRMEARPDEPMPPPPPPMTPQPMSYEEAVERGSSYAREGGYEFRLEGAHLAEGRVWLVNFRIFEHERPGRLH